MNSYEEKKLKVKKALEEKRAFELKQVSETKNALRKTKNTMSNNALKVIKILEDKRDFEEKKNLYAKNFLKTILKSVNEESSENSKDDRRLKPGEYQIAVYLLIARITSDAPLDKRLMFDTQQVLAQRFTDYTNKDVSPVNSTISSTLSKLYNLGLIEKVKETAKKDAHAEKLLLHIRFNINDEIN